MKLIKLRTAKGFTLTEMIVTSLLLGLTIAAIGEVAVMSTFATTKMTNSVDCLSASRVAADRIASDVRSARAFGDFYAAPANRAQFPGDTNNPLYGSQPPSGGWPTAPWTTPPYVLNAQTLIIQQPVLFLDPTNDPTSPSYAPSASVNPRNGFPMMVKQGALNGGTVPAVNVENLDTVVYQVVADPEKSGQFLLQMARFPGAQLTAKPPETVTSSYKIAINPPQTILKGIIGPKDPANAGNSTALPSVFRYYTNSTTIAPPQLIPINQLTANISNIRGVATDFEVFRPDSSSTTTNTAVNPAVLGLHSEAFTRANTNASLSNF
jgi:prepilin-type N-terminal cleavage/methylation domain-containing protein